MSEATFKAYSLEKGSSAQKHMADARRIVVCVNACEGMTDEQVSHGIVSASVFSSVVNQRDELLEALEELSDYADRFSVSGVYLNEEIEGKRLLKNAAAAIAKATNPQTGNQP